MTWIKYKVVLAVLLLSACCGKIYNFKGENIPTDVNSISIEMFSNEAQVVNPELSINLTEKLKTKFQSQTQLVLQSENGDYQVKGKIVDYRVEPAILNADQGTSQNNFTIGIVVSFTSEIHPEKNFEKNYSNFVSFNSDVQFETVEKNLANEILDNLVQQIFSEIALDW